MTARTAFEDASLQRMEQAALWLQRMRDAGPDERLVEDWLDWCQRDPLNQQAFDEMTAIWDLSGSLSPQPLEASVEATATGNADSAGRLRTRRFALAASLAGLGLAAVSAVWRSRAAGEPMLTSELASPVGVNSAKRLADGSLLELGGGTRVTVTIGAQFRRVELHEGELFVTVKHDVTRPFTVDTGKLEVLATGTAFNVLRTDARTTVTVAEGSVNARVGNQAGAAPNMNLQSSQRLIYAYATRGFDVREADPRDATAWRTGTLFFENEPLSEVIAKVNRYAARKIVIEDSAVGALLVTGTARTDRIQGWLQALPQLFPVTVVGLAGGNQLITLRPDARSD